jgi:hypothetical protein
MYEPGGAVCSLDNGVPVPRKLAAELTGAGRLQPDLFLRPNDALGLLLDLPLAKSG